MPIVLSALGSLGGLVAFIGAVWILLRSIFAQTNATRENTNAIKQLTNEFKSLDGKVDSQGERIAALEGWRRNGSGQKS